MWPFRRKQEVPKLNSIDQYRRWIRAQRPPFEMFLSLSEMEQEAMAIMGDEYLMDIAQGAQEPPTGATGEDTVTSAIRQGISQVVQNVTGKPPAYVPPTTAGLGKQKDPDIEIEGRGNTRLFGKMPDGVKED